MSEESANELLRALVEAAERERRRNREYSWECPDCGEENEVDPAVVELCSEHWTSCNDCGERYSLNLSGKP